MVYYRSAVASEAFASLDSYLWRLSYKWALRSHRNKTRYWVAAQHFGMFNRSHQNRWVFGDRSSGAYMLRFSWTRIVRHQMVPGRASPDDPDLGEYWARRRQRTPPLGGRSLNLFRGQHGRCAACGALLVDVDGDAGLPEWSTRSPPLATWSARRWLPRGGQLARWTNPPPTVLYTPTVGSGHRPPSPRRSALRPLRDLGLLEPDAVKSHVRF
jgi:hypothetical protein